MSQSTLFDLSPDPTHRNWLCPYEPTCKPGGVLAVVAAKDTGACVNVSVRCEKCGRTGVTSARKDLTSNQKTMEDGAHE